MANTATGMPAMSPPKLSLFLNASTGSSAVFTGASGAGFFASVSALLPVCRGKAVALPWRPWWPPVVLDYLPSWLVPPYGDSPQGASRG
jgi:hypothetical protein